jgi:hypothetical protein
LKISPGAPMTMRSEAFELVPATMHLHPSPGCRVLPTRQSYLKAPANEFDHGRELISLVTEVSALRPAAVS